MPQIGHDADNGRGQRDRNAASRRGAALQVDGERDAPANRIFVREVQRGEPLVDHRRFAAGHAVLDGQVAAALQRQPDGLEVVRIDRQHRHVRRLLALVERLAVDRELAQEAALHRRVAGDRHGFDFGIRIQPLLEPLVEGEPLLERGVFPLGKLQRHRRQLRGVDAEVEAVHRQEIAHHEARAREQDDGERQLGDHQRAGPPSRADAGAARSSALLEDLVDVGLRHVECRRQSEDDAGAEADQHEEPDHVAVDRELDPVGPADVLRGAIEQADANRGDAETSQAADRRQHHALDQQLADDAPARRADRHPHRDFPRPVGGPRQQQVGDVGAGNQQHERHGAHQGQEHRPDRAAVHVFVEGLDLRLHVLVGVGVFFFETLRDREHLALRLFARHAGRQASEDLQRTLVALLCLDVRRRHQRLPQIGILRELEAFGHHADDDRRHIVDPDGLADDSRV